MDQVARLLRRLLLDTAAAKEQQGFEVRILAERIGDARDVSALLAIGASLRDAQVRSDWPYVEPDDLVTIQRASDAEISPTLVTTLSRETPKNRDLSNADGLRDRIRASFMSSVCGCVLGKPLEVQASLAEIKDAALRAGEPWPLNYYVSEAMLTKLGRRARDWKGSTAGQIAYVPADDDLNFRVLAMLILERRGRTFDGVDIVELWSQSLPIEWVWGSNRTLLIKWALHWWRPGDDPLGDPPIDYWRSTINPYEEDCGALIRIDPYAYAAPGRPAEAAALAWRDASVTHSKTGVYAAMFQAAALSVAFVEDDPLEIFTIALRHVPRQSRFHERIETALGIVANARDWEAAYLDLERALGAYGHCRVYFELGTEINAVRFAKNAGHGIGLQVSQGLDTDSFGASCGAILGARFGTAGLAAGWTRPFDDELRTTVAGFHEHSLEAVASRMAELPGVGTSGTGLPPYVGDP